MEKLPDLTHLSHAEKDAIIQLLWEQNQLLKQKVMQLEARIKQLEDQLAKNSRNSSKPPSSDGRSKPNPKSRRKKGSRSRGGQKGHMGVTLKRIATPEVVIDYMPSHCNGCGADLGEEVAIVGCDKRQVFDVPVLKIAVTEHRSFKKRCNCCDEITAGQFPEGVSEAVQYGHRIKTLAVYMSQYQLLPYGRLKEFFHDLFGHSLSTGTLVNINEEIHQRLEKTEKRIEKLLKNEKLLHVDETGIRIDKKPNWLHVMSTKLLTYYAVHPKRGSEAIKAIGILPSFKGTLVHDCLKSYFFYGGSHALCNAHHLRELTFIQERYGCVWAKKMEVFLLNAKDRVEGYYKEHGENLPLKEQRKLHRKYKKIVSAGLEECPRREREDSKKLGRVKQTDARNFLERLRTYGLATLAFMFNAKVPFDNNQAERDIRMTKVKHKISGCFRSKAGSKIFCRVRGYLSTMKKNSVGMLEALEKAFTGQRIFLPAMGC